MEKATGKSIYSILQLRLHPAIIALKKKIQENPNKIYDVDLTYITSRGKWYHVSWKGDEAKSGGIATNIGVHFFDMLGYLFGTCTKNEVHLRTPEKAAGYLEFSQARVRWFLSIDRNDIPAELDQPTYRSITIDAEEIEFSGGFTDLHTLSYQEIHNNRGFRLSEVKPSIEIVSEIRKCSLKPGSADTHPFVAGATS